MRLKFGCATLVFVSAIATSAHAASLPEGCGSEAMQFKVKAEKGTAIPAVDAGKALLVFVQTTEGEGAGSPLSRFAVDGEWVGAARGKSYIVVPIAPGAHKLCASRQSGAQAERDNVGAAHLDVVAGKTYYLEFKIKTSEAGPAGQAGGGAGLMLNNAPDMTAKRHETIDTAQFLVVSEQSADDAMKHAQHSVSTPK
jgi:hypothetical protein